jgi:hypothetical protein
MFRVNSSQSTADSGATSLLVRRQSTTLAKEAGIAAQAVREDTNAAAGRGTQVGGSGNLT